MSVFFPPNSPIDVEELYCSRSGTGDEEMLKNFSKTLIDVAKMMQNHIITLPVKGVININNYG
jgi:hypothetical protein